MLPEVSVPIRDSSAGASPGTPAAHIQFCPTEFQVYVVAVAYSTGTSPTFNPAAWTGCVAL